MDTQWMLSADSHVIEPPETFATIDPEFRDRAPKIVEEDDADWYYLDGLKFLAMTVGAQPGKRFEGGTQALRSKGRWSEVPRGAYDSHAHIVDNEADGVWGSVLYPTLGFHLFRVGEHRFFSALARAYNDWVAAFCAPYPDRLRGVAIINLDDVDEGVAEMQRARAMGLAACLFAVIPGETLTYDDPRYEPAWAAAQDLDMPIGLHVGANRTSWAEAGFDKSSRFFATYRPNIDATVRTSLTAMLWGGVFERYPRLRVGAVEFECGWVPHWLARLDDTYEGSWLGHHVHRYRDYEHVSDVFREHCFVTFQEDDFGLSARSIIGCDTLMWGNDYPHTETTWPRSREVVDRVMHDLTADERHRLTVANVSRVYKFELPAHTRV